MKTFLHLAVNPIVDSELQNQIELELNEATDWLRYLPNCWLIYTGRSAKAWYERLTRIHGIKERSLLICEINLENRAGWIKRSVWEWIDEER